MDNKPIEVILIEADLRIEKAKYRAAMDRDEEFHVVRAILDKIRELERKLMLMTNGKL